MYNWNIFSVEPAKFGSRIRQARERLGMSQDDLAASVSKDQRAISEYENGKRKLAATDLPLFASVLQVPLLYFFGEDLTLQDFDSELLKEFHRLRTESARQAIIEIIRIFSNTVDSAR